MEDHTTSPRGLDMSWRLGPRWGQERGLPMVSGDPAAHGEAGRGAKLWQGKVSAFALLVCNCPLLCLLSPPAPARDLRVPSRGSFHLEWIARARQLASGSRHHAGKC